LFPPTLIDTRRGLARTSLRDFCSLRLLVAACLLLLAARPCRAAAVATGDVPEVQQAVNDLIRNGGNGDHGSLGRLLSRPFRCTLDPETRALVVQQMPVLERGLVAAQHPPYRLDPALQALFREHASPSGRAAMRAVLRQCARFPEDLLTLSFCAVADLDFRDRWSGELNQCLQAVQLLADYRNPDDRSFLAALYDTVGRTPISMHPLPGGGTAAWFLRQALQRYDDPAAGAIFRRLPERDGWVFARSESEITAAEICLDPNRNNWHEIPLPATRSASFLARLATSPAVDPARIDLGPWTRLRIHFRDGMIATINTSGRWIWYEDNTRYGQGSFASAPWTTDIPVAVDNPALGQEVRALAGLVSGEEMRSVR
jgi:hypothetical protein